MQEAKTLIKQSAKLFYKAFKKRSENKKPLQKKKAIVSTIAGNGKAGLEDGPQLMAKFKSPLDVAIASDDTIYVADGFNSCVRKIVGGEVSTFAGNGNANIKDGIGTAARFKIPSRLAYGADGNLYLLDAADPRIRKITPATEVSTHAGMKTFGFRDGDPEAAQFGQSFGIATDAEENIYISDSQNDCIRKINTNGQVITIATSHEKMLSNETTTLVEFCFIKGIVIDKKGNLFVADLNRILKITPNGVVSAFAGNGMKAYNNERWEAIFFSQIEDLVMDAEENIYLSEGNRIHKITSDGIISTIAGHDAGYEDGDAFSAKFNEPKGLGIDRYGNLYVADSGNNRIRKISFE